MKADHLVTIIILTFTGGWVFGSTFDGKFDFNPLMLSAVATCAAAIAAIYSYVAAQSALKNEKESKKLLFRREIIKTISQIQTQIEIIHTRTLQILKDLDISKRHELPHMTQADADDIHNKAVEHSDDLTRITGIFSDFDFDEEFPENSSEKYLTAGLVCYEMDLIETHSINTKIIELMQRMDKYRPHV